jgi:hypothetical protein
LAAKTAGIVINNGKSIVDMFGKQAIKYKEDKNIIASMQVIIMNGKNSTNNKRSDTKFSIRFDISDMKWHATCIDNRKIDHLPQLKSYYENKLAQALIKQNDSLYRIKVCNYKLKLIDKYLNKKNLTYKDVFKIDAIPGLDTPEKSKLKPILNDEIVINWIKERLYSSKDEKFTKMLEDTLNEYFALCNMR